MKVSIAAQLLLGKPGRWKQLVSNAKDHWGFSSEEPLADYGLSIGGGEHGNDSKVIR